MKQKTRLINFWAIYSKYKSKLCMNISIKLTKYKTEQKIKQVFVALAFIFLMNISYEYELEINVIEQMGVEAQFVLIKQSKNRRRTVLFRQCAINSSPFLSRTRLMVFVAFIFLSLLSLILVFCPFCRSLFIIFVVPWFWRGTNGCKDKVIGILGSGSSLGFTFASRHFRQFFQSTRLPTQKGTFLVAALHTK